MKVQEIDKEIFAEFAKQHILKNYFQTKEYGNIMTYSEFEVMYIGGYKDDTLVAASLILYKSIAPSIKYGYAPRGFLINYYDTELLKEFTKGVKDFFFRKAYAFIKINPEVTYSMVNFDNKTKTVNSKSEELINILKELGYDKLKDNLYFESLLPKYTPVINLNNFDDSHLDEKLLSELKNNDSKGIYIMKGNENDIDSFYPFVEEKDNKTISYYKIFYEKFKESNMVDLLLLNLDYDEYAKYLQRRLIKEQELNDEINAEFKSDIKNNDLYKRKIESDNLLNDISYDISLANIKMQESVLRDVYGAALITKYEGRITIVISGQKSDFRLLDAKSYMFYTIIQEYKNEGYDYIDLNGITGDFTNNNPYKKLNEFKLKFKPSIFEYIGEFDLIVNKPLYQLLSSTNKIQKEFYGK